MDNVQYYIAIDGGGTGTRFRVLNDQSEIVFEGKGSASALSLGIENSWEVITDVLKRNLKDIDFSKCYLGAGISGVNNLNWKKKFSELNPGFARIIIKTDGFTTLLGAHDDQPGIIIALGTGSIGMAKNHEGVVKSVSGWGYPSGDEASGSWLGIHCVKHAQKFLDGRVNSGALTKEVLKVCGDTKIKFLKWLGQANQTQYASLSPVVFSVADKDPFAQSLIDQCLVDIEQMILALDHTEKLSVVMCGKLGEHFESYLPKKILSRCQESKGTSLDGAMMLLKDFINES